MRGRRIHVVLALVLALVIVQGALSVAASWAASCSARNGYYAEQFQVRTDVETSVFAPESNLRQARLHMQMNLTAGEATWVLWGPDGLMVGHGTLKASEQMDKTYRLGAAQGEYKLTLALVNATGAYDLEWSGR